MKKLRVMYKHFFFLLLIMGPGTCSSIAQQTVLSARDEQMRKHIGMNMQDYGTFSKGIKQFNKRLVAIMHDTTLNKEQQRLAIDRLYKERMSYVQKYLNADQQKKLQAFERTPPADAMAQNPNQVRTKRMKKGQAPNAANQTIQN